MLASFVIHHRRRRASRRRIRSRSSRSEEGPRMMTSLIDVEQTPEALVLDMPLEVAFEKLDDEISLPVFRPRAERR
jgi:hypothetical protein